MIIDNTAVRRHIAVEVKQNYLTMSIRLLRPTVVNG